MAKLEPACFTRFDAAHPKRSGRTLIVGSKVYATRTDRRTLYQDAVGVDMEDGEGVDVVVDMELEEQVAALGTFAHVDCLSVMEHSKRPWLLARNIEAVMEQGGTLLLTVPFIWRVHAYPSDYWRFTTHAIEFLFPQISWKELTYAHSFMDQNPHKIPVHHSETIPYMARTETYGFGERV